MFQQIQDRNTLCAFVLVFNKFSRQKQDMPFIISFENVFWFFLACGEEQDMWIVRCEFRAMIGWYVVSYGEL